jgi:hypothetical protein
MNKRMTFCYSYNLPFGIYRRFEVSILMNE